MKEFFIRDILVEFAHQIRENTKEALLEMTSEQLKTVDKKKILNITEWLKMILQNAFPEDFLEFIDKLSLAMALKFFQIPYLEKRILGLHDIKVYIQKVSSDKISQDIWVTKS